MLCLKFPDEGWIPELARYPQVFTAAEKGVRFTAFGGGGYALDGEIVLFAASDGDESIR